MVQRCCPGCWSDIRTRRHACARPQNKVQEPITLRWIVLHTASSDRLPTDSNHRQTVDSDHSTYLPHIRLTLLRSAIDRLPREWTGRKQMDMVVWYRFVLDVRNCRPLPSELDPMVGVRSSHPSAADHINLQKALEKQHRGHYEQPSGPAWTLSLATSEQPFDFGCDYHQQVCCDPLHTSTIFGPISDSTSIHPEANGLARYAYHAACHGADYTLE